MSRRSKVKKENPEALKNEDILSLIDQADIQQDIKVMAESAGGKIVTKLLIQDVVNKIMQLEAMYKTASHVELIAVIADMLAYLNTAKLLTRSKENLKLLDEQIAEALTE